MRVCMTLAAVCLAALQLQADKITSTAIACPDMEAFKKIKAYRDESGNKELYIMQQGCVVLTPKEKIHVLEPDRRTHGMFLRVQVDRTNEVMYVHKKYVKVEQSGSGNVFKF